MIPRRLAWARILTAAVAVLMAVASVGGLWIGSLYRDAASVRAMFRGYDLVALVVAVPLLVVALLPRVRDKATAQILWLSGLMYAVYNYAYYVFGASFNDFLLIHVALLALSLAALVTAMAGLPAPTLAARFRTRTPARWVAGILALLAVSLGGIWVSSILRFAVTGELPHDVGKLVLPAGIVHLGAVMDLTLLIPAYGAAAMLLWQRRSWGFVAGGALLISGLVHQLSYMAAMVFQASARVPGATFDTAEPIIIAVYLVAAGLLLRPLWQPMPNRRAAATSYPAPTHP